ncbi:MAG TPA: UPF0158 family protein [Terriglobia bacterium]|nr:UPF0158 family protein [Terriglobia bacterium]
MMPAVVKLEDIIEALELVPDEAGYFLCVETGEVHRVTDEEFRVVKKDESRAEYLRRPAWQRQAMEVARKIQEGEGKRYLELPGKFDVHEWEIMDRFALSIQDERVSNDLRSGIRGAGAFRMFESLLDEYDLRDRWNRFKQAKLREMAEEWCEANGIPFREKPSKGPVIPP